MKKKIFLLFALLSLIVISGCEGVSVLPVQSEESFEEKIVEDVEIISSIWNSLMYDCISSIGNSESFDSAKEIEVTELAKFAYTKTIRNNGYEVLEKDDQNRFIISKKQIEEVSDKYFNLSEVNFEEVKSHSYIEDTNSFGFYFTPNERIPNYDESNAWGISLESVKQVDKNRYQVELNSYFDSEKQHIQTRWIYQLEDAESNWIILSMEKYFPDNNLVNIEGNVETISKIEEYPKSYNDDNMKSISIKDNKMFVLSNLSINGEFTNIF